MWTGVRRSGATAVIAIAAALALTPGATATPMAWAFSDSTTVSPLELQTRVVTIQATSCHLPTGPRAPLSLGAALLGATQMLRLDDGPGALHRFAISAESHRYRRAMDAAAAAMLANRADVALVARLRAHALAPTDPRPLLDASVLLTAAQRPNEALACWLRPLACASPAVPRWASAVSPSSRTTVVMP